jgi:hypothetical protein
MPALQPMRAPHGMLCRSAFVGCPMVGTRYLLMLVVFTRTALRVFYFIFLAILPVLVLAARVVRRPLVVMVVPSFFPLSRLPLSLPPVLPKRSSSPVNWVVPALRSRLLLLLSSCAFWGGRHSAQRGAPPAGQTAKGGQSDDGVI